MCQEMPDRAVIQKIQHGSPDEQAAALRALYLRYHTLVRRHVTGHVAPTDAADVEQDAWKEVIASARKVELRSESARGWILGILRRVVARHFGRPTPEQQLLDEDIGSSFRVAEAVERSQTILEFRKAWRALTPEQRVVVFLADIVGAPVSEVIRWTGGSRQAIYQMHRRAREAIQASMELIERGGEPESEWLESFAHTNIVIDLRPDLSEEEHHFLAKATGVQPGALFDSFEVGMALFVEATEEYLEELLRQPAVFRLALLSREGLEEYLAATGEGCDVYLFQMTLEGNCLTIDARSRPLKTRTGWRLLPEREGAE